MIEKGTRWQSTASRTPLVYSEERDTDRLIADLGGLGGCVLRLLKNWKQEHLVAWHYSTDSGGISQL